MYNINKKPIRPKNSFMKYKTMVTREKIIINLYPSLCIFGKIFSIVILSNFDKHMLVTKIL